MSINKFERAKRLFIALGQIGDSFIEEARSVSVATQPKLKKAVRYGAVGAAASLGFAVAVLVLRPRIINSKNKSILRETA